MKKFQVITSVVFVVALIIARTYQKSDSEDEILAGLLANCGANQTCITELEYYGEDCIDESVVKYRKGKYSRGYELDEQEFKACIKRAVAENGLNTRPTAPPVSNDQISQSSLPSLKNSGKVEVIETGSHAVRILNERNRASSGGLTKLDRYEE